MTESQSYLSINCKTKNHWWIYLIGTVLIYDGSFNFFETWFTAIFTKVLNNSPILDYSTDKMAPLFTMVKLFLGVVCFQGRSFKSLVRISEAIRWKSIFLGFLACFLIELLFKGFYYLRSPQDFIFSFTSNWFLLLPIALLLQPIQTSSEELFFRGYLMQGMAVICRNKFALIVINGLIFMLSNIGNPELQQEWMPLLHYFIFGVFAAYLTIRDNGLELALGFHAAHNLQIILLFNTKNSVSPTPSIWQLQPVPTSWIDIGLAVLQYAIFYYIFFGIKKSPKTFIENN